MNLIAAFKRKATGGGGGTPPPSTPTGVVASPVSDTEILVSWNASTNASEYVVWYRLGTSGSFTMAGQVSHPTTQFSADSLIEETLYQFYVVAIGGAGSSAPSSTVSATTYASGAAPPDAPSDISAVALTFNSVRVTWSDNSDDEDGFRVYRSVNGGDYSLHATVGAGVEQYDDTSLTPTSSYAYTVAAHNTEGESTQNGPASVSCLGCLNTPDLVDATGGATDVTLTWNYTTGTAQPHTGFQILRNGSLFATVGDTSSYLTTGVTEGVAYNWQVRAYVSGGQTGPASNTRTAGRSPNAPSGATCAGIGPCYPLAGGFVRVMWTDNSANETGFVVEEVNSGLVYGTAAANGTQLDIANESLPSPPHSFVARALGASSVPPSVNSNAVGGCCGE